MATAKTMTTGNRAEGNGVLLAWSVMGSEGRANRRNTGKGGVSRGGEVLGGGK